MNRQRRRQQQKRIERMTKRAGYKAVDQIASNESPDFSGVPLVIMCQSIQLLLNEMRNRGFPLYDFDDKKRSMQQIQIIGEKVYFMAAEEVSADEKSEADERV